MNALLLLVLHANGFAPVEAGLQGSEPTRTFAYQPWKQGALRASGAWTEFSQGEGKGWTARFDEESGRAHRAWGPAIALPPIADAADAEAAVRGVLSRHRSLVGVPLSALSLRGANYVARTHTWYVEFDQIVGGAPIWRAGLSARIVDGGLVMLGIDTHPQAHVSASEITANNAIVLAQLNGPARLAQHRDASATLVVLPQETEDGLRYALAWQVRSTTTLPVGQWVSFVDAQTGEVLAWYNDVRFLEGTVSGTYRQRSFDSDLISAGLPLIEVIGTESGSTTYADEFGAYTLPDDSSATSRLRGRYVETNNASGSDGSITFDSGSPTITTINATQAEIASYAYLHQVRDWSLRIAPEVQMATLELRSNVNDNSGSCNAYYDGNVNFYSAGDGCNNTGEIADVNYHEWGHGFHYYSLEGGSWDGTIGEAVGDVVSILQTSDSTIGPYFVTSGAGIRELDRDRVYPDDLTGYVHEDSLIFSGAVWDLWEILGEQAGESREDRGSAWLLLSTLFANAIKAGPTLETVYDEFVLADDDDGDVTNGTPNLCAIAEAFGRHGLGPMGTASPLSVQHTALVNVIEGTGIPVTGTVLSAVEACVPLVLARAEVKYSIDNGENWETVAATVSGNDFTATFPDLQPGTIVLYYLEIEGDDGTESLWPAGGEIAPFTFYVGELVELYCQPFAENDDGGYTHELLDGDEREGADDWAFDDPKGYADDPTDAFTDRRAWGNDLGGGNYNGAYQPDIVNRLSSPEIDPGARTEVVVQYRRWLNVEDGVYDRARVYAGENVIWENYESTERNGEEHTQDRDWILHTLAATVDGPFKLGWEIESDGGLEFGGWNIDDVCVYGLPEAAVEDSGVPDESDSGETDTPGKDDGSVDVSAPDGCGCDATGGAAPVILSFAAALAMVRRRREL